MLIRQATSVNYTGNNVNNHVSSQSNLDGLSKLCRLI